MIKAYYQLTKPGIIYGNALTAAAGFFAGSQAQLNWWLLLSMLAGISLVMASACVYNNYLDQDIDARMERTKTRALPLKHISGASALWFATILGIAGVLVLYFFTTLMALAVAVVGWVVYVALYSPLKRRSASALFVGAIAGATPPVVGYTAVTNTLDITALLLFAFLFIWQIPHFIAIALYRYDEYTAADIPLLIKKPPSAQARRWGRTIFYWSLVVLLAACLALILQR